MTPNELLFNEGTVKAGFLTRWFEESEGCPIEIDIGCNLGDFLLKRAQRYRSHRFLGVEYKYRLSFMAAEAMCKYDIDNVRLVNMEAFYFISKCIPTSSINGVHIYFPTPQERLLNQEFERQAYRILKHQCFLRFATDPANDIYFDEVTNLFASKHWLRVPWTFMDIGQPEGYLVGTPAEIQFSAPNKTLGAEFRKK